jgi:hypothetical protein
MDRADAIRLLQALAAVGVDTRAPRPNVWIEKKALEIVDWKAANSSAPSHTQEVRAGWLMPLVGVGLL